MQIVFPAIVIWEMTRGTTITMGIYTAIIAAPNIYTVALGAMNTLIIIMSPRIIGKVRVTFATIVICRSSKPANKANAIISALKILWDHGILLGLAIVVF